jgi:purine operon repressor
VAAIMKILVENPGKIIGLNKFTQLFNAAKSTVSEDIVIVRETLGQLNMGKVETIAGAAGGIKYLVGVGEDEKKKFALDLCEVLADKGRVVPGNFIYMTDVMYNPAIISPAGKILASFFSELDVDYVVTVETKGIPLAFEVAKCLGVQLVIVRRENKVTEGPTVIINYVSGSTGRIQNMSLSKKSIAKGSKCIFIDDFMKAGGTALGISDLLKEFDSELLGMGVMVDNIEMPKKLVTDYVSIVELSGIDEDGAAIFQPSVFFK